VDISGGSNVGSLSDLNDVGSAGAGNGEVLVGDNTNYNSTLLSTAAGSHLDLADLNNAQYSSLTGTPSIPVAGDGLDNNSGDFDIDVSDFAGDGLTSNANDLDVGSTVARTNQAETFDNTITITADGTSKEGFVLNDSSGGFIGEFRNNGGNANFRAASGADFGIGINGTGGAEIKIVDGSPSFTAFSVAGSEVGRFKSGGVFDVSGDITASGEVEAFVSSDRRLKTDLDPVGSALDKVDQLTGYGFDWRKGDAVQPHKRGKTDVGLIAQEVEDVLPEAVKTFTDGHSKGYKSVSYDKLVPLLIEAIKDLREQIEAQ